MVWISMYVVDAWFLIFILYNFQWKFAFLSLGRPEYLEDSDILFNRFQVLNTNSLHR